MAKTLSLCLLPMLESRGDTTTFTRSLEDGECDQLALGGGDGVSKAVSNRADLQSRRAVEGCPAGAWEWEWGGEQGPAQAGALSYSVTCRPKRVFTTKQR